MTREWVLHEIRELTGAPNTAKNAYDLAVLYVLLDHMPGAENVPAVVPAVIEDERPTLDKVEKMLGEISVTTADDRRRAQDAHVVLSLLK